MGDKVKLLKTLRYGVRIFEQGTIGEITEVTHPLSFHGIPVYDFYVQLDNHKPIGVFKHEVERVEET